MTRKKRGRLTTVEKQKRLDQNDQAQYQTQDDQRDMFVLAQLLAFRIARLGGALVSLSSASSNR